ncbi:MAG: hypothetical protein M1818_003115 [Claussenomyces sp. TS43310]|nr:MAG: hypothetical protein M1818_003115 [Claussenomyces sp. TS43310]
MEEFDVSYALDNEQQFWDELDDIVSVSCQTHQLIDNALRSYLHFTTNFRNEYLHSEYEFARCSQKLLQSELFHRNKEYVKKQVVYSLLQEDDPASLHVIASLLLFGGRQDEGTFEIMNEEGCFSRLLELIKEGTKDDLQLHRLLLELLYEMSRVQRLNMRDLSEVDDDFVRYLFRIIEELSDDVDDPYHYPVIRVLLVLNEQYMVASTTSSEDASPCPPPLTNRVIKILSLYGSQYMTFGENIILLLNRETETSLQLLILKLLYLIFTTKATCEYFYTNDLRVLLDVIIRNLLDLPNELISLRHTYLRVLYPLLAHTQLSEPPHYKREEIIRTLSILGGSASAHFAPADTTTVRLVERVAQLPWLRDEDISEGEVAKKLLGISLSPSQTASAISVVDVAAVMEKPGVQTPSKSAEAASENGVRDAEVDGGGGREVDDVKLADPMERQRRVPPVVPLHKAHGHKKLPPKTPPRRRTRLKVMAAATDDGL